MKKITKILISLLVFTILIMPAFSSAYKLGDPIIPCGTDATAQKACDFNDFMDLVNNVIKFIFVGLVVPIAAIMFFYAGFKMVTSGGSAESRTTAKNVFSNAAFGLVVSAGAWLIIRTILSVLGYKGDWIGF